MYVGESNRERERERVSVCVGVSVCVYSLCLCLCVCVRVCCVCVCVCVCVSMNNFFLKLASLLETCFIQRVEEEIDKIKTSNSGFCLHL